MNIQLHEGGYVDMDMDMDMDTGMPCDMCLSCDNLCVRGAARSCVCRWSGYVVDVDMWIWICGYGYVDMDMRIWICG